MAAIAQPVSNIAVAFGRIQDGRHASTNSALPTPPSSLSPTLPAHKQGPIPAMGRLATPDDESMEIDLQDAVEHAAAQDQPSALSKEALAGLDATRQITALMLARNYLPDIIAGHGAMPIREMMAHLAQSVPGFSGLQPAKARRLVVAALEHRAGGGLQGEVKFEKVGWGRWSVAGSAAQAQGVPIGASRSSHGQTPPSRVNGSGNSLPILNMRDTRDVYAGSWNAGSWSPHRAEDDEEMADNMSLDGSEGSTESDSASDMDLQADLNDDTDEEDWAALGPQAFRESHHGPPRENRDYNYLSRTQTSNPRYRSVSAQTHSLPHGHSAVGSAPRPACNQHLTVPPVFSASRGNHAVNAGNSLITALTASSGITGSGAERDAIEALIAMGSM